jgi:hypothetical protein
MFIVMCQLIIIAYYSYYHCILSENKSRFVFSFNWLCRDAVNIEVS